MASNPPPDTMLRPLTGPDRPLSNYLAMFHLVLVVIDPFTLESAWLLDTAAHILDTFGGADCRVGFLVAGDAEECQSFLGPYAKRFLTFTDSDRSVIKALGLAHLPAIVHLGMDATIIDSAEEWHPGEWRRVTDGMARMLRWKGPQVPAAKDPAPFPGSPALG